MAFRFKLSGQPKQYWNSPSNNYISYKTGVKTLESDLLFTEALISKVLQTAPLASVPKGDKELEAVQKALANTSTKVEVVTGVRLGSQTHIHIVFNTQRWQVNIAQNEVGEWAVIGFQTCKTTAIEVETDYPRVLALVRKVLTIYKNELLSFSSIHGMGIGFKKVKGEATHELAIIVHVEKKIPFPDLERDLFILQEISFSEAGSKFTYLIPIDVQEAKLPELEVKCKPCDENLKERIRPVPGGYSIAPIGSTAGTLGGWVWDNLGKRIVLLSNAHVLSHKQERKILQPGPYDGGTYPRDYIAKLVRSAKPGFDAAIAAPRKSKNIVDLFIACEGEAVLKIAEPKLGMEIEKVGRTTGRTCGKIAIINYFSRVLPVQESNNIFVDGDGSDFSKGGDSGSLYIKKGSKNPVEIVGLHWGGIEDHDDGFGLRIQAVFDALQLKPLGEGLSQLAIRTAITSSNPSGESVELPALLHYPADGVEEDFLDSLLQDLFQKLDFDTQNQTFLRFLITQKSLLASLFLDRDGWRASIVALSHMLKGKITTDEVLGYRLSSQDVLNIQRVILIAKRIHPNFRSTLETLHSSINYYENCSMSDLLQMSFAYDYQEDGNFPHNTKTPSPLETSMSE